MIKTYLSQTRYNEVKKELAELKSIGRRRVAERLKHAKELGDLSENSEYQEAREEQSRLEARINQLEELLRRSVIIEKNVGTQVVKVGSQVKVKVNGGIMLYTIVGSEEARPQEGFISNESPLGKNLLGKKIGERVEIKTPKGERVYEILSIE